MTCAMTTTTTSRRILLLLGWLTTFAVLLLQQRHDDSGDKDIGLLFQAPPSFVVQAFAPASRTNHALLPSPALILSSFVSKNLRRKQQSTYSLPSFVSDLVMSSSLSSSLTFSSALASPLAKKIQQLNVVDDDWQRKKSEDKATKTTLLTPSTLQAQQEPSLTTKNTKTPTTASPQPAPLVQRSYRTYQWQYNGKTYDINYRVEQQENEDVVDNNNDVDNDKPPVLLVHGFGANLNHFRHQYPALTAAGFRVYAIDLIGFGASTKAVDVDYSIDLFVQLLTDFVQAMNARYHSRNLRPWIVAGNSMGGLCCLGLAQALPRHVQGVVLFNCAGGMSGFRYQDLPLWVRPILYLVQNVVLQGTWGKMFFANFKTQQNVESILRQQGVYRNQTFVNDELLDLLLRPADDEGAETVFLKVFGGPPGPTPEHLLRHVHCPILAIWGEQDPWTPYDKGAHPVTTMSQYHARAADFQLHVLPQTGHCPHDENPMAVHNHMIPWMLQVPQRYIPGSHDSGEQSRCDISSSSSSSSGNARGSENEQQEPNVKMMDVDSPPSSLSSFWDMFKVPKLYFATAGPNEHENTNNDENVPNPDTQRGKEES